MASAARSRVPSRHEIATTYDLGVDAYAELWSPVILPPARAVVAGLDLTPGALVLDIGAGTGALVPAIRAAAPGVTVVGVDPARAMLAEARRTTSLVAIQGDACSLPVGDGSVDAALLAFVLFHLDDPARAVAEAARVLVPGGRVGTTTWVRDPLIPAYEVWDAALSETGAPALPARRDDTGLDSRAGIESLLDGAGLRAIRTWPIALERQWDPESYWRLLTGSGVHRLRLRQLDAAGRRRALELARPRLDALAPEDFAWSGEVLCAVAATPR
jgi:SAM-dependent methyltransferase